MNPLTVVIQPIRLPPGEVDAAMGLFAERLLRQGEPQEDVLLALRYSFGVTVARARQALAEGARHARTA